eukprot:m.26872 g.26872  ORF g.26872 m.26872 type:complete len:228 (-) comp4355_c0_seq1:179-862(-)
MFAPFPQLASSVAQTNMMPFGSDSDQQAQFDMYDYNECLWSPPPSPQRTFQPMSGALPSLVSNHDTDASHTPPMVPPATSQVSGESRVGASVTRRRPSRINRKPSEPTAAERLKMKAYCDIFSEEEMMLPKRTWEEVIEERCAPATKRDYELLMLLRTQAKNRQYQATFKGKMTSLHRRLQVDNKALRAENQALRAENGALLAAYNEVVNSSVNEAICSLGMADTKW